MCGGRTWVHDRMHGFRCLDCGLFQQLVFQRERYRPMSSDPTKIPTPAPQPQSLWSRIREAVSPYVPTLTRLGVMILAAVVGAVLHHLGAPPQTVEKVTETIKEIPVPVPTKSEAERAGVNVDGWQPDHDAGARAAADAVWKTFADTPAGQVAAEELPRQIFLWQAEQKLTGKPTPLKDQNPTGSCVGFGTTTAIERTLAADIVSRGGDASEFTHFSEEVTYAGSKVQGARALGASVSRQDGSAGVFAQKWVTSVGGMVPKAKYDSIDLTEYSASRARSWNLSGCPSELIPVAKKYPVKSAAKVTNWQQAKQSLASGYGVAICASWSYSRQRDANGVAVATREGWNHCMACDGYYVDPASGKEYGHIENSWSNLPDGRGNRTGQSYHQGPTGWGNPTTAGFWASSDSVDRALKQGDSYAYSGATGFPAKKLPIDWFVNAKPKPVRDRIRDLARGEFALAP